MGKGTGAYLILFCSAGAQPGPRNACGFNKLLLLEEHVTLQKYAMLCLQSPGEGLTPRHGADASKLLVPNLIKPLSFHLRAVTF